MYTEWKVAKDIINPKDLNDEETRKKAEEAQNEYTKVAEWCNQSCEYHIEDIGEYYAVIKNPKPTQKDLLELELYQLHTYLNKTDYITAKLTEVVDNMEEYETMKAHYKDQLDSRAAARVRIREIEKELEELDDESGI